MDFQTNFLILTNTPILFHICVEVMEAHITRVIMAVVWLILSNFIVLHKVLNYIAVNERCLKWIKLWCNISSTLSCGVDCDTICLLYFWEMERNMMQYLTNSFL